MRWVTYERWVAKYDAAEDLLDAQLVMAAARQMRRLSALSISMRNLHQAATTMSLAPKVAAQMWNSL
jgi:hypothetical protein